MVDADQLRVERIAFNLRENASKYYSTKSEIRVSGRVDGDFVITEVIDQGKGIAPEDYTRIFELFEQLKNSRERQGESSW